MFIEARAVDPHRFRNASRGERLSQPNRRSTGHDSEVKGSSIHLSKARTGMSAARPHEYVRSSSFPLFESFYEAHHISALLFEDGERRNDRGARHDAGNVPQPRPTEID